MGSPAVALAVSRRLEAFAEALESRGIDVPAAIGTGRLALLDAHESLERISGGGRLDAGRFRSVVGDVLDRATSAAPRGRPRIYGEIVDVLWGADHPEAAIELEGWWNELGDLRSFTLLCGYDMARFSRSTDADRFRAVCQGHSHVRPTERFPLGGPQDHLLREVVALQQRAQALEREIERREHAEAALRRAEEEVQRLRRSLETLPAPEISPGGSP